MMKPSSKLKAVELFAGIGGFRLACENKGIETIWANDIDKDAAKVYRSNFGENSIIEGDINNLIDLVPPHNLLTAGFPCQPFSSAGKKRGISDPRGTLFEAIIKILQKNQPQYFILENVKRLLAMDSGRHFATILEALANLDDYVIEWRVLNTMSFGLPQHRERVVITGYKNLYNDFHNLPKTKLLSPEEAQLYIDKDLFGKDIQWSSIEKHKSVFPTWGIANKGSFMGRTIPTPDNLAKNKKLVEILETNVDETYFNDKDIQKRIENSRYVNKMVNGVRVLYNQKGGARMGYTIFGTDGLAPTLTSSTSRHYERYFINGRYRRLTNTEYGRIQGFPSEHCKLLTPHKQYKLFGNAVAPQMITWALSQLLKKDGIKLN